MPAPRGHSIAKIHLPLLLPLHPAGEADQHFLGSLYTTAALDGQTRGHLSELVAAEAASSHSCCLCLGHNKGWEEAASSFAVGGQRRQRCV